MRFVASDEDMLERWRAGDTTAGNELFNRHFKSIYRFFRNKVAEGVDDLVQKTFLACVEGRFRIEGASFRTYMFAAARNILYREFQTRVRDGNRLDFGVTSVCDIAPSPTRIIAKQGEQRLIAEAMRRVPLDFQVCLELYYYEGLRGPALASALGIPEATVRSRLRRGLEKLRKAMEEIAPSQAILRSTIADLDTWAASLKDILDGKSDGKSDGESGGKSGGKSGDANDGDGNGGGKHDA